MGQYRRSHDSHSASTVGGIYDAGKNLYQSADYLLTGDETSRAGYERTANAVQGTVKGTVSLVSDSYDTYGFILTGDEKYRPGFDANAARGDAVVQAARDWKQRYDAASDYEKSAMLTEGALNIAVAVVGTKGLGSVKVAGEAAEVANTLRVTEEVAGAARVLSTAEKATVVASDAARASEIGSVAGETGNYVKVYRVEGVPNQRIVLGEGGQISLAPNDNMLFLNFGEETRAQAYLQQKIAKGLEGATIKSFDVEESFLQRLQTEAVPQRLGSFNPGRPQLVDVTKAPNQFGLPSNYFEDLLKSMRQGSGR